MQLKEISGTYDAIFSLGSNCLPAYQLQKNKLRRFTGVIDWVISDSLADVNQLLKHRFNGFLELQNLKVVGYSEKNTYFVKDVSCNILTVYDFLLNENTREHLSAYPQVKEKYNRRIRRFLDTLANSQSLLFIRSVGNFQDVHELQSILSEIVMCDFKILVVNHANVSGIVEKDWGLKNVCVIELPDKEIWDGNNSLWREVLKEVALRNH
ncbi:papain-like cysteine peptidase [Fodinisporobacter ferrooxydans]|uniref:Papain-like cysteine peptidase n=1 Tax=Fodinisporobacter ferrooxydans TaxID=2901836 RepID=A0ABY4CRS0_9BACL|nr:papain-like cysteine peptidase [Alicyclobacillaceae bacterium MYW30-H2]